MKDKHEPFCVGVFSTYDKAAAYIEKQDDYDPDAENYDVEEWMVDDADLVS
jgi:hypothetical protein